MIGQGNGGAVTGRPVGTQCGAVCAMQGSQIIGHLISDAELADLINNLLVGQAGVTGQSNAQQAEREKTWVYLFLYPYVGRSDSRVRAARSEQGERRDYHQLDILLILKNVAVAAAVTGQIAVIVVAGVVQLKQRIFGATLLNLVDQIEVPG